METQQEFALVALTQILSWDSEPFPSSVVAQFSADQGVPELQFYLGLESNNNVIRVDLPNTEVLTLGPVLSLCISKVSETSIEESFSRVFRIQFRNVEERRAFNNVFQQWKAEANNQGTLAPNGVAELLKENLVIR